MKRILLFAACVVIFAGAAPQTFCRTPLDEYFNLRRESLAVKNTIQQVSANPEAYIGSVVELRGVISGTTRIGDGMSAIIATGGGSYIVSGDSLADLACGSRVGLLVQVGDKCVASLSDLRVLSIADMLQIEERERRAIEAEKRKRAAKSQPAEPAPQVVRQTRTAAPASGPSDITAIYRNAIRGFNKRLSENEADVIAKSVLGFASKHKVDPRLVVAVILAESNFNPNATSKKGAMGLGQLMPGTAAGLGVSNAYDPVENIGGSVKLIKGHLDKLSGNADWSKLSWNHITLALASYNAGPGAVKKYGGVPPYRETQNYVNKVISIYKKLCGQA